MASVWRTPGVTTVAWFCLAITTLGTILNRPLGLADAIAAAWFLSTPPVWDTLTRWGTAAGWWFYRRKIACTRCGQPWKVHLRINGVLAGSVPWLDCLPAMTAVTTADASLPAPGFGYCDRHHGEDARRQWVNW